MQLPAEKVQPALRDCISYQLAKKSITDDPSESWHSKLDKAFHEVPQVKYIEQAQYMREHMLPKIEKSRGIDSPEYKFYYSVFESLMYAISLCDRDQSLRRRLSNEKLMNEILHQRTLFYESELQRYTTLEDLTEKELATELLKRKAQ